MTRLLFAVGKHGISPEDLEISLIAPEPILVVCPLSLFAHAEARSLPGSNRPPPDLAAEPEIALPAMTLGEQVVEDYRNFGLTLRRHPCALLRPTLARDGNVPNADLTRMDSDKWVAVSGLVVVRRQPGTASGVTFCDP